MGLWQQSFHPGCQKRILGVYMSSLRDVGITSDITWRETFFETCLKNFDLFHKTAYCLSKGTFLVKKVFFESSVFFELFGTLNEQLLCLAKKFWAGISKLKFVFLYLQNIMLRIKIFFWKFCRFSFYSDLEHNCFEIEATERSPSLSKFQSTCLYEFSLRCCY